MLTYKRQLSYSDVGHENQIQHHKRQDQIGDWRVVFVYFVIAEIVHKPTAKHRDDSPSNRRPASLFSEITDFVFYNLIIII